MSEKIIKSLALIIFILAASAGLVAIFFSHFPDHTKTQKKDVNTIAEENPDADFLLVNGNRILIKRKLFEEYINGLAVI